MKFNHKLCCKILIYFLLINVYFVNSLEYSSCNKLWGVTQDANGKMLYKVGMYMCVEDPYDIYKNAYSSTGPTPLLQNNLLPNPIKSNVSFLLNDTNVTSSINATNVTLTTVNNITNATLTRYNNITNVTLITAKNITNATSSNNLTNATKIFNNTNVTYSRNYTNTTLTINNSTNISPLINKNNSENISYPTSLRVSNPKSLDQPEQLKKTNTLTTIIIIISAIIGNFLICGVVIRIKYKRKIKEISNKQKKIIQPQQKEVLKPHSDINDGKKTPYIKRNQSKIKKGLKQKRPHQPALTVDTKDIKQRRNLKLNHNALTPNTQHILDESKKSVQHWYEKTFPKDIKPNNHLPPISRVHPLNNNTTNKGKPKDGRVRELIKQKELSIREIQSGKTKTKMTNNSFAK